MINGIKFSDTPYTPEGLPMFLGHSPSPNDFTEAIKKEKIIFFGQPHDDIVVLLNGNDCDYLIYDSINHEPSAERTLAISYFGLGYRASSIPELENQFAFLSNSLVKGGRAQLIIRGLIPENRFNVQDSNLAEALEEFYNSNTQMIIRMKGCRDIVGAYDLNAIAKKFGFKINILRCPAQYSIKAVLGWNSDSISDNYPVFVELIRI